MISRESIARALGTNERLKDNELWITLDKVFNYIEDLETELKEAKEKLAEHEGRTCEDCLHFNNAETKICKDCSRYYVDNWETRG